MRFMNRMRSRRRDRLVGEWMEARASRVLQAQDDLVVANAAGSVVRADINANLQALGTLMSGTSAPGTTYAHMLWADTTNGILKRRNALNSAWIPVRTLDEAFVLSRSSDTILDGSDVGKTIVATASFTQTLTAAATLGDGWWVAYRVEAGATITFDPNSTENIDGAATKVVAGEQSGIIYCNGSAFFTIGFTPVWSNVFAYNSANDANVTGNGATVTVDLDTEITDALGEFSGDTFTAQVTGQYLVTYSVRFAALSTAMSGFLVDAVVSSPSRTFRNYSDRHVEANGDNYTVSWSRVIPINAAGTLALSATISGGAGNTATIVGDANHSTSISITRVR